MTTEAAFQENLHPWDGCHGKAAGQTVLVWYVFYWHYLSYNVLRIKDGNVLVHTEKVI